MESFRDITTLREFTNNSSSSKETPMVEQETKALRSPICCVLGPLGVGKTKLLDVLVDFNTSFNSNINPQIILKKKGITVTAIPNNFSPARFHIFHTLVFVDTSGCRSSANLRNLALGLCDFAILVVDISKDLQPQINEYLNLFKLRNTKYIIAFSKLECFPRWKPLPQVPSRVFWCTILRQSEDVQREFFQKFKQIEAQFKKQGMAAQLWPTSKNLTEETVPLVPISTTSGEGIPDLFFTMMEWIESTMLEKIAIRPSTATDVLHVTTISDDHYQTKEVLKGPLATAVRVLMACNTENKREAKFELAMPKDGLLKDILDKIDFLATCWRNPRVICRDPRATWKFMAFVVMLSIRPIFLRFLLVASYVYLRS